MCNHHGYLVNQTPALVSMKVSNNQVSYQLPHYKYELYIMCIMPFCTCVCVSNQSLAFEFGWWKLSPCMYMLVPPNRERYIMHIHSRINKTNSLLWNILEPVVCYYSSMFLIWLITLASLWGIRLARDRNSSDSAFNSSLMSCICSALRPRSSKTLHK